MWGGYEKTNYCGFGDGYGINTYINLSIYAIDKIYSDDDTDITVNALAMGNFDNRNISTDYKTKTELNLGMLAIGASLAVLAWDNFADAGDISDTIKDYKDLELNTSKLEKTRSRKNSIGAVLAVSSIITFVYSFERVQVQASPTSLSLSYKF